MRLLTRRKAVVMVMRGFFVIMITMMHIVTILPKAFFAMEDQKIHTEGVESSHKNTCHHSKIREP